MKKGILIILDGYGEGEASEFNAVENANTPTLKMLKKQPYSLLNTYGEAVGLFESEMGGSEVGHTTIGAGRIVNSTAKQIRDDMDAAFLEFVSSEHIKRNYKHVKNSVLI